MAVSKMKLVNISGSLEALGAVTRACGESGVFQPDDTLSARKTRSQRRCPRCTAVCKTQG